MRFLRLDLTRFGPFTDISLDLSAPGTHVVLGRNEAGKTTAMTAIAQLLYGIPVRTRHAFVHDMANLRLGALLEDSDGTQREIIRVKKNTNTLQDPDGTSLDEAILTRLLHDITEDAFTSLFAVGHEEIVAGGEALLTSDGEVGRALFSASRGTTDLTAVLRKLDARADELFKKSAAKPELNKAISSYKDATSQAKALATSSSKVVELDKKLAAAKEHHARVEEERRHLAGRKELLRQVQATRPLLVARSAYLEQCADLEHDGPLVDVEIRPRLEQAEAQRLAGETAAKASQDDMARLDQALAGLTIDTALLDHQDTIQHLTELIGAEHEKEKDLPKLQADTTTLARELEHLRKRLPAGCPVDDAGRSAVTVAEEERISQLEKDRPTLDAALQNATDNLGEADADHAARVSELAKQEEIDHSIDVATLEKVTARIRKEGDLETKLGEIARTLAALQADLDAGLATLGLTGVDSRAVDTVVVPTIEVIRKRRDTVDSLARDLAHLDESIGALESEQRDTAAELALLLRSGGPLTPDDLLDRREHRDHGWRLIRSAWIDNNRDDAAMSDWSGERPFPDAYEDAVSSADDIADRLRREAEAVERRATLEQRLTTLESELAALRNARDDLAASGAAAEVAWVELWTSLGISAGSPDAMETWHDAFGTCMQLSKEACALDGDLADLDDTVRRHCTDLRALLQPEDSPSVTADSTLSLLGLLDRAEALASATKEARQTHESATAAVTDAEELLTRRRKIYATAEAGLHDWSRAWSTAVAVIGLTADASPAEARVVLDALRTIDAKSKEHDVLALRIDGINKRSKEFTDGVDRVRGALDPDDDLADASPVTAVKMLSRRVAAAVKVATEHATTTRERETHQAAAVSATTEITRAQAEIAELVGATGAADEADLLAGIVRSEKHADLSEKIADAEKKLREQTGKPVTQVEIDATEFDGVEILPEIEQLETQLKVLNREVTEKLTAVGELKNERAQIDSSDAAADRMSQAQQSLAQVVDLSEEYIQVVLAKRLLEEQVAAYRDENQGPLLERARELFTDLTLSRYTGLDTDIDPKGNPYLLARRSDDRLLQIAELSTGTRDQLYLALRLAALEQFMARRGPLPLVLDDLFVHFDDDRTRAGLQVLDSLADQTQVLLFTHHSQVAAQAAEMIPAHRLTVRELA